MQKMPCIFYEYLCPFLYNLKLSVVSRYYEICSFGETVVQDAPDHKQRTLEPPVLSLCTLETYAPLRAEGSESVPAVVCAFCATWHMKGMWRS